MPLPQRQQVVIMASPVTPPLSQTEDDVEMQKASAAAVVEHEIVMLGESTRAITERIEGLETALEVQHNFHKAQGCRHILAITTV